MEKRFLNKTYLVSGGMVVVTMLAGGILTLPGVSADDSSVSTATITVPVSCSLIGITNTAHTAEIPNGIDSRGSDYYPNGIGQTTLKAFCNDSEGFSIYAVGFSDDTLGNTYLRDTTLGGTADIQTSTTFSGANSAWAMKIGVTTGSYPAIVAGSTGDSEKQSGDLDYSTWQAIPNSYTRVAYRNSATDVNNDSIASAEGSSVTTTYAAYISATQSAGTYVGKVKYTLIHPSNDVAPQFPHVTEAGAARFYPNASNAVGTMGKVAISDTSSYIRLIASNYSRSGYGFAGWSDVYDYDTNPNAHYYGPSETFSFTPGEYTGDNDGASFYAVWVPSAGSFQDANDVAAVCGNLTQATVGGILSLSSVSALTDSRDGQTYAIAKLADGKCWMIENLRLTDSAELTILNTNSPRNDGTTVTLKHNYSDSVTYNNLSPSSSVAYNASTAPDGWCNTLAANCIDQSRLRDSNTTNRKVYNYSDRIPYANYGSNYSFGNNYNWYSATAGKGTFSDGSNNSSVNGDLCPAGWRLPKGGQVTINTNGDFYVLAKTLMGGLEPNEPTSMGRQYYNGVVDGVDVGKKASNSMRSFPNNFTLSGWLEGAYYTNSAWSASYWTSTTYYEGYAYRMEMRDSYLYPGNDPNREYIGNSIRCIASISQ